MFCGVKSKEKRSKVDILWFVLCRGEGISVAVVHDIIFHI